MDLRRAATAVAFGEELSGTSVDDPESPEEASGPPPEAPSPRSAVALTLMLVGSVAQLIMQTSAEALHWFGSKASVRYSAAYNAAFIRNLRADLSEPSADVVDHRALDALTRSLWVARTAWSAGATAVALSFAALVIVGPRRAAMWSALATLAVLALVLQSPGRLAFIPDRYVEWASWSVTVAYLLVPALALAAIARAAGRPLPWIVVAGPPVAGAIMISFVRMAPDGSLHPPRIEFVHLAVLRALVNLTWLLAVVFARAQLRPDRRDESSR